MTLPSSGSISLGQVRTELVQTGAIPLGSTNVRTLFNRPSGAIRLSDGYSKSYNPNGIQGTLTRTLTKSGLNTTALFGQAVDLYGTNLMIGAPGYNLYTGLPPGRAFIFTTAGVNTGINQTNWAGDWYGQFVGMSDVRSIVVSPLGKWGILFTNSTGSVYGTLPIPAPNDHLEFLSVEIEGAYSTIGVPNATIGSATLSGTVHVYLLTTLLYTKTSPSPITNGMFGISVSAFNTYLCIGEPGAGKVHVYNLQNGSLIRSITSPDAFSGSFGFSVAVYGNYLVVGDQNADLFGVDTGMAYLFDVTTGGLIARLNGSATTYRFGQKVDVGTESVVVTNQGTAATGGTVNVYDTTGQFVRTITSPAGSTTDGFGTSISIYDKTLAVGAPGANKVYLFK